MVVGADGRLPALTVTQGYGTLRVEWMTSLLAWPLVGSPYFAFLFSSPNHLLCIEAFRPCPQFQSLCGWFRGSLTRGGELEPAVCLGVQVRRKHVLLAPVFFALRVRSLLSSARTRA